MKTLPEADNHVAQAHAGDTGVTQKEAAETFPSVCASTQASVYIEILKLLQCRCSRELPDHTSDLRALRPKATAAQVRTAAP